MSGCKLDLRARTLTLAWGACAVRMGRRYLQSSCCLLAEQRRVSSPATRAWCAVARSLFDMLAHSAGMSHSWRCDTNSSYVPYGMLSMPSRPKPDPIPSASDPRLSSLWTAEASACLCARANLVSENSRREMKCREETLCKACCCPVFGESSACWNIGEGHGGERDDAEV